MKYIDQTVVLSQLRIRREEEWATYISSIQEIAVICAAVSNSRATRGMRDAVALGRKRKAAGEKITRAIRNHFLRRNLSADCIIRVWRLHKQVRYK